MNTELVCCFSGHRMLKSDKINDIKKRLSYEIKRLVGLGVTNFISGAALGFDQIAAITVIAERKMNKNVRLILALPCRNQDKGWTAQQRIVYGNILSRADEIRYISDDYSEECMKKCNFYMIDNSAYCICAMFHKGSGTGQTIKYAREKGVTIINVAKPEE